MHLDAIALFRSRGLVCNGMGLRWSDRAGLAWRRERGAGRNAGLHGRRAGLPARPPRGGAGHQCQPPARSHQWLGHWHGAARTHWPHHPGVANRYVQRRGPAHLCVAHHHGGAGAAVGYQYVCGSNRPLGRTRQAQAAIKNKAPACVRKAGACAWGSEGSVSAASPWRVRPSGTPGPLPRP